MLTALGVSAWKLKCDGTGPPLNLAFNFNLRRYGEVQLLQDITQASRVMVGDFVSNASDPSGRLAATALGALGNMFGGANVALPWGDALKGGPFATLDVVAGRKLFGYLQFCLEQIVKDNELGALTEALEGQYVLPGPGGDPIRNPKVWRCRLNR